MNQEVENLMEQIIEQVTSMQISIPIIMDTLIEMLEEKGLIDKAEYDKRLEAAFKETYKNALKRMENMAENMEKEEAVEQIKKGNIILN